MAERNHLVNGRFLHNLNGWTAVDAAYNAGAGDDHYGVALLEDGGSISQTFGVAYARSYSLHSAVKPTNTLITNEVLATLTDGDGNTLVALSLEGTAATWTENTDEVGLAPGTTFTLTISNDSGADVSVDDVWLWFVPLTRAEIAARVHAHLGQLATDRSLSTTAVGALTEGDYTYAVDAGLRNTGAVNPETGEPDVRYVDPGMIAGLLDAVELEMLRRLERDYATVTDLTIGPRREARSQTAEMLAKATQAAGGGKATVRKMRHRADDYEMG